MPNSLRHSGPWFDPQSVAPLCDPATYTRGLLLYRNQKVLSLDIEPLAQYWHLLGEVQGSQRLPYELSIELTLTPDGRVAGWDSECDCPVGYQCKHGVALLLKAAYQGLRLFDDDVLKPVFTPPTPEELEARRQAALEIGRASCRERV